MSTHKLLVSNFLWLTTSRLITKVIALFSLPVITFYLSPNDFGVITMFSVVQVFLSGFFSLGFDAYSGRMIFKYERSNKEECKEYLGVIFFYLVIFSVTGALISIIFINPLFHILLGDMKLPNPLFHYVPIVMAFLTCLSGFSSGILLNLQLNKRLFYLEMAQFVLFLPAEIIGLSLFSFTVWDVIILQMIVQTFILFLGLWLTRDWLSFSIKKLNIFKDAMHYSLPMVPLNFAGWIQDRVDKIFLNQMISLKAVGIYAVGVQMANQYSFLSRPIATTVKPEISKRLDLNNPDVQTDIKDFFMLFFQFSIFLYFAISLFSKEIVRLFLNMRFHETYRIIPIFLLSIVFSELTGIFQLKFIFKNRTIWFSATLLLSAILNAGLNFLLIPKYDIYGASFAKTASELFVLFLTYFISQQFHKSDYNLRNNFIPLIMVIGMVYFINMIDFGFWLGLSLKTLILSGYIAGLDYILTQYNKRYVEFRNLLIGNIKIAIKKPFTRAA